MFESQKVYTNRYGEQYHWEPYTRNNSYVFRMQGKSLQYCRFGGKPQQHGVDLQDLGMFDPSGGPYVELGASIDGKRIVKIRVFDDTFIVEVGNE